jgi:arsenate reductase
MSVQIFHNPHCSKSRQTLALLEQHGIKPEIILYLDNPPDANTLKTVIQKLGISARDLLRTREAEYAAHRLKDPGLSDEQIIALMTQYPKLIERPIVINGDRAAIGRPPESVLEIIA